MKLRDRYENWLFRRALKNAGKQFRKVSESSVYNKVEKKARRNFIKEILRSGGFVNIRIREKK